MKSRSIVPNAIERVVVPGRYIISTTDIAGRITSVNAALLEYSGYSRAELINAQHNIFRHPDMPRTIYSIAWSAIRGGEDFSCYIKNLCKDGSYYWVFAHILPQYNNNGDIVGYRSVRRAPDPESVRIIEPVYAEMLAAEKAAGTRNALRSGSMVLREFLRQTGKSYDGMVASL